MKLEEKLFNAMFDNLYHFKTENVVPECEKIVEDFAIGFALWKETNAEQDENGLYYNESRIQVSRHNPITINQLLEIYKKQKGL
jgi:hypothetical protein